MDTARTVRVTIDGTGATVGGQKVKNELSSIAAAANRYGRDVGSAQKQTDGLGSSMSRAAKAANDNGSAMDRATRAANDNGKAQDRLNGFIKAFIGLGAAKYVIGLADSYTRYTNALRVANVEGAAGRLVQDKLYASAQKYGVQLEAMGKLYGKASQAQKSLNASQADLLKFTDGVAAALKVQGGGVNEASGALHQLGQVLTGNKVQAEEYNSIIDGAYPILQAVAAGIDKYKGSVAALTADVKKGNVTSKEFFDGFLKGSSVLEEKAAKSAFTVSASFQVLSNAMTKYIGEADQANGVTAGLGAGMRGLAENLDTVVPLVSGLALALGVGMVANMTAAAVAARGVGGALLGAFGGPIGIAITVVTAALFSLYSQSKQNEAAFYEQKKAADSLGISLDDAAKKANSAAAGNAGVGAAAKAAGPAIDGFRGKVVGLTGALRDQAVAARQARIELLKSRIAESDARKDNWERQTEAGQNTRLAASQGKARTAWQKGDYLGVLQTAGTTFGAAFGGMAANAADGLSNGRTSRDANKGLAGEAKVRAALERDLRDATGNPITKADLPGGGAAAPAAVGDRKKKGDGSSGASEAERKAKAQKEFWDNLENEKTVSEQITANVEKQSKIFAYQKIVGRDITADEEKRLSALLNQTKANQYVQQATESHRQKMADLDASEEVLKARLRGATEEQLQVEQTMADRMAELKKANITLSEAELKTLKDQVSEEAKRTAEIAKRNKMLDDAESLAKKYSPSQQASDRNKEFNDGKSSLDYALQNGKITKQVYDETIAGMSRAVSDTAMQFKSEFGNRITELGDMIGGKWGAALGKLGQMIDGMAAAARGDFSKSGALGGIANILGHNPATGAKNALGNAFADANKGMLNGLFSNETWKNPLGSMTKSFKGFGDTLKQTFGKGGDFMKGMGTMLGNASGGMQIGGALGSMLGLNKTGSNIGGALGGLAFGPIGGAIGGLLGGVIGKLLTKTKKGQAIVTQDDVAVSGNSDELKQIAGAFGSSIQASISSMADQLGTSVGNYKVSIAKRSSGWIHVDGNGAANVGDGNWINKSSSVVYNGKDEGEALKAAIKNAVGDGALVGISDFTRRTIMAASDLDQAVGLAKSYEDILKSLKDFEDPIAATVREATKGIDQVVNAMKNAGATATELANAEKYRTMTLASALAAQTKGYADFIDELNRSASGKTQLQILKEDQSKYSAFKATIDAGGTVNQDQFLAAAKNVMSGTASLYGSQTSVFQSTYTDILTTTENALGSAARQFLESASTDKTPLAIDSMKTAVVNELQLLNANIAALVDKNTGSSGQTATAVSGKPISVN